MTTMFTSGRDYRPAAFWGDRLPPNTQYVRLVLAAPDEHEAEALARRYGLYSRYGETLVDADTDDGPAQALTALRAGAGTGGPGVYLVTRAERDLGGDPLPAPQLRAWEVQGADVVHLGYLKVAGMGRPDNPYPVVRAVAETRDDDVPVPDWAEGPALGARLVDGALGYPEGAAGDQLRQADQELLVGLALAAESIAVIAYDIERARITADPRDAWRRQSPQLYQLARTIHALARQAVSIEAALAGDTIRKNEK